MDKANRFRFRAWDGTGMVDEVTPCTWENDYKSKVILPQYAENSDGFFVNDGVLRYWEDTDLPILMQSIGLTDKNGKEIFEGDIIDVRLWPSSPLLRKVIAGQDGNFVPGDMDDIAESEIMSNHSHRATVVGNIYENPELIKD